VPTALWWFCAGAPHAVSGRCVSMLVSVLVCFVCGRDGCVGGMFWDHGWAYHELREHRDAISAWCADVLVIIRVRRRGAEVRERWGGCDEDEMRRASLMRVDALGSGSPSQGVCASQCGYGAR
jgi:hypothetical protein